MVSQAAQVVANMETDLKLPGHPEEIATLLTEKFGARPGQLQVFGRQQWTAPVASGSNPAGAGDLSVYDRHAGLGGKRDL